MADRIEHVSERHVPATLLACVNEMISRALLDLEKLVQLRAQLTGDDPFGDRQRQELANQRARQDLERMRAEARQRDPEGWAAAHARAQRIAEHIRNNKAEMSPEPPVAVRVATETVQHWRDAYRAESQARRARARPRAQELQVLFGDSRDDEQPPEHRP